MSKYSHHSYKNANESQFQSYCLLNSSDIVQLELQTLIKEISSLVNTREIPSAFKLL